MKALFVLLCMSVCLMADIKTTGQPKREFQIKIHDINQVEMTISNYGKFGPAWWPKESQQNYIFWGAGIWFGTIDSATGDTLVTVGYNTYDGQYEFAPGLCGQDPNARYVIIYMYPDDWPPPADTFPMAPQEHVSHQDSWCAYNDCDSTYHMPGDTRPIGIEVYQTVYAWDMSPFPYLEDIIFFTHEVKNVSDHTLQDCYIGVATDCDIGYSTDINDHMAGIVGRWFEIDGESLWVDDIGYQWQEEPEADWNGFPGTIGFDLLQTPFDLVEGEDKDNDGIPDQYERDSVYYWNNVPQNQWDVDNDGVPDWRDASKNPQLGMTALKRFSFMLEPNIDAERYMTLAGYNFVTSEYEPYDTIPSDPENQRFLMSSGPFDLAPDSSVTVVFAIMFADWKDIYQTPDTGLAVVDNIAQYWYDMYWFLYTGVEENSSLEPLKPNIVVNPNPIIRYGCVSFSLLQTGMVSLKLYNTVGQLVKEIFNGHKSTGNYTIDLSTHGLTQGTYFLVLETSKGKTFRSLVVLR